MRFCNEFDKGATKCCENLRKTMTGTLAVIRQASGKESMSHTRKVQIHLDRKSTRQVKSIFIFFEIKGIDYSQRIWPGGPNSQFCLLLWGFTVTENVLRLHPKLWRWKNWPLHYNNAPSHTSSFTGEFFLPEASWLLSLTHPTFLCFLYRQCLHVITIEVTEQNSERGWTPQNMNARMCLNMVELLGIVCITWMRQNSGISHEWGSSF
jgi:hypothetical protein